MDIRIKGKSKLSGSIRVPASKSLLHRAIIAASLAKGKSIIRNASYSSDIEATIKGMEALGAKIIRHNDFLEIYGSSVKRVKSLIDCNESGSTLRFLIPIAMLNAKKITFIGKEGLAKRPLAPYFDIFKEKNIKCSYQNSYLPLEIEDKLRSGEYNIRGDISSQFITGLLFALPLLENDSRINITTKLESKGYIDLTLDILKLFGIEIINDSYKSFIIKGNQSYKPTSYICEGDYSQAAFYLCMNALGSEINILDMNPSSHQGDKVILEDLEAMGANIIFNANMLTTTSVKRNTIIDLANSPDLGPALACLMALGRDEGKLINAQRLRLKECDRLEAIRSELNRAGIKTLATIDTLTVSGMGGIKESAFDSHNDHRIAMALSILSLGCDGDIIIRGAECVNKSYPSYWDDFKSLGGEVSYE